MGWRSILSVVLLVLVQPRVAGAQCSATRLCAAGTGACVVSSPCTIPAGATFDVRPRELVVAQGMRLTVGSGTAAVAISAGVIRLEAGSQIVLQGGLRCRLDALRDELATFADDDLGGAKTARSLEKRVARADRQAAVAAGARNPTRPLRRVQRELRRFEALLARAGQRGTIASDVTAVMRGASAAVRASLDGLTAQGARSASTTSMLQESHARTNSTMPISKSL